MTNFNNNNIVLQNNVAPRGKQLIKFMVDQRLVTMRPGFITMQATGSQTQIIPVVFMVSNVTMEQIKDIFAGMFKHEPNFERNFEGRMRDRGFKSLINSTGKNKKGTYALPKKVYEDLPKKYFSPTISSGRFVRFAVP